jgi:hypothetical protein
MEYIEYTQERTISITAESFKVAVLKKVSVTVSEKGPALRVTKAVADYYYLHINLRLDFIDGKPKKTVVHLESVIMQAILKALIERKLEMDKSNLKKDFLEFVAYLEMMAIIHEEHCHVVEHKKAGDSCMKNTGNSSDSGSRSSGHNSGGSSYGGGSNKATDRDRTRSGRRRSSDSTGTGKQSNRETSPCHKT